MTEFKFEGKWEQIKYRFEAFEGLQSRAGAYASRDQNALSDGTVFINIDSALNDEFDPTAEQIQTINWISENPNEVRLALFESVLGYFNEMKERYGHDAEEEDLAIWFPHFETPDDLGKVMGVKNVYVSLRHQDGTCVYSLECGCTWDEEHGMALIMHKDKVLQIGDVASTLLYNTTESEEFEGAYTDFVEKSRKRFQERMQLWRANPLDQTFRPEPKRYNTPHPEFGTFKPAQIKANERYLTNLILGDYSEEYQKTIIDDPSKLDPKHLDIAVANVSISILETLKTISPALLTRLNETDSRGKTQLDKLYNKINGNHTYNDEYLRVVNETIRWIKSNGGKTKEEL